MVAAMATSRGASYVCAGVGYDLGLGHKLVLTPTFAPGLYARGKGLDLGYPVEFRSQIQIDYRLPGRARAGVAFSHMSNVHLGQRNSGVETLMLSYSRRLH